MGQAALTPPACREGQGWDCHLWPSAKAPLHAAARVAQLPAVTPNPSPQGGGAIYPTPRAANSLAPQASAQNQSNTRSHRLHSTHRSAGGQSAQCSNRCASVVIERDAPKGAEARERLGPEAREDAPGTRGEHTSLHVIGRAASWSETPSATAPMNHSHGTRVDRVWSALRQARNY